MGFTRLAEQPGPRAPGMEWADNGPGLHTDEVAVQLDTGELVAVSVEPKWPENNSGLALHAWGRLINADGSSKEDPTGAVDAQGRPVVIETSITANIPQDQLDRFGEQALSKELMLAVLGEPMTMTDVDVDEAAAAADAEAAPPGTVLDPTMNKQGILPVSAEALQAASIRLAIARTKLVRSGIDPAAALGI